MANSICKRCKFYDRCDEDNLMRSYVTSPDKNGCPHFGMLSAFDDVEEKQNQMWARRAEQERQRKQERFDERIGSEIEKAEAALTRVDDQIDRIAAQAGISRFPTDNMHEMMYGVGYMQWQEIRRAIEPFDDDAIVQYNDFLERNRDLNHNYRKKDPREPYNLYMQKIDEILQTYRDYGLTGPGAQREEIRKQAEQWQKIIDAKKAEERRKAEEERKKQEEKQRKIEEEKAKKEAEKQERIDAFKKQGKKFWIIWGIVAFFVLLIGSIFPSVMFWGVIGLGIAIGVRYYKLRKLKEE